MSRKVILSSVVAALVAVACLAGRAVVASDHDDGETDQKARALNLTDLYVFREGDQNGVPADNANLIFIMNTNPRSVARQQYYFSSAARYEFRVTRQTAAANAATGQVDVLLRFTFFPPDATATQTIRVEAQRDGFTDSTTVTTTGTPIRTTPLSFPAAAPTVNTISLLGSTLTVFAGLREDPFFFDVEQYFRVRAGALGFGPAAVFRPAATALDFARGYNVNALVVRVPIAFLAAGTGTTVFDVWETISLPTS